VAEQDRPLHAKLAERFAEQLRLLDGAPVPAARPLTVAIARPVEENRAIAARGTIDDSADLEVGHHRAVTMEHDDGLSRPLTVHVVEPDAVNLHEAAPGRICALGFERLVLDRDCRTHSRRQGRERARGQKPCAWPIIMPVTAGR
jgi:hypothetical protein